MALPRHNRLRLRGRRRPPTTRLCPAVKRRKAKPQSLAAGETPVGPGPLDTIRADKVARARQLVNQPGYPPKEVTRAIARILARKLSQQREADEDKGED
jgi:hypothetical protein